MNVRDILLRIIKELIMHSFVRRIEPVVETIIHRLYIVAQNQISLIPKVYTSVHYNSKMPSPPPRIYFHTKHNSTYTIFRNSDPTAGGFHRHFTSSSRISIISATNFNFKLVCSRTAKIKFVNHLFVNLFHT